MVDSAWEVLLQEVLDQASLGLRMWEALRDMMVQEVWMQEAFVGELAALVGHLEAS